MPFKDPEAGRAYRQRYRQAHKETIAKKQHARYEGNKEAYRAKRQAYKAAHRAALASAQREYAERNKGKIAAYYAATKAVRAAKSVVYRAVHQAELAAYVAAHKEERAAYSARHRARTRNAPINDLTPEQWREIKAAYEHRCVYCQRKMHRLTQDHIIPLAKGGNHTASNIVPACMACNRKKWTGPPLVPVQPLLLTIAPSAR